MLCLTTLGEKGGKEDRYCMTMAQKMGVRVEDVRWIEIVHANGCESQ